jgi:ATP-dependent protease ClpP protease subunit
MIPLIGEVGSQMLLDVVQRLNKNPHRANFLLCSMGGALSEGLAIYDRILAVPKNQVTATGVCASAATVILQAGNWRRATPNTQFMFHLAQFENLQDNKNFKPHFDLIVRNIFRERMSAISFTRAINQKIFGAAMAKEFGLIDEIWDGKTKDVQGLFNNQQS